MNTAAIKAMVHNGRIEVDVPDEWPEGTPVAIEPLPQDDSPGMREEDWPTSPEGIAALLKSWNEMEPLEITREEQADIDAWRKKVKQFTIENQDKILEDLRD